MAIVELFSLARDLIEMPDLDIDFKETLFIRDVAKLLVFIWVFVGLWNFVAHHVSLAVVANCAD